VAWVSDGGAAWYNPAGLASVDRTSIDLSASAFLWRYYALPDAARTVLPGGGTKAEDASFSELVSVPSAVSVVRKLGDGVAAALAVYVPHREELRVNASFDTEEGAPYEYEWSLAASRATSRYYFGPGLGIELTPAVRAGLSVFVTYEGQYTTRDFHSSLLVGTAEGTEQSVITVRRRVESKLFGTAWSLGWQWDLSPDWAAGVCLRGPLLHLGGTADVDFGTTQSHLAATGEATVRSRSVRQWAEPDVLDIVEPARITLGLARRLGQGRISLEGGWQAATGTPGRERQAIWNVRAGATFPVSERFVVGGGLFTDLSPDLAPAALGATHVDFFGGAVGVQLRSPYDVQLASDETVGLVFSTSLALRYALGVGEIGSLRLDPFALPAGTRADVTIHELGLHLGTALDF
jgi:hypothetical protein